MPRKAQSKRFKHKKDHDRGAAKRAAKARNSDGASTSEANLSLEGPGSCLSPPPPVTSPIPSFSPTLDSPSTVASPSSSTTSSCFQEDDTLLSEDSSSSVSTASLSASEPLVFKLPNISTDEESNSSVDNMSTCSVSSDHEITDTMSSSHCLNVEETIDPAVIQDVKKKVELFLYSNCICMTGDNQFIVLILSRTEDKVTQRQLNFSYDGTFSIRVHCRPYPVDSIVEQAMERKTLTSENVPYFVDRMVKVINLVRGLEICSGVDNMDFKDVWNLCLGVVDMNAYKEKRYTETFRSVQCEYLVNSRKRRCGQCTRLVPVLERKHKMVNKEEVHPNTPNIFLGETQKLQKLEEQRKEIDSTKRKLERLRIQKLIEKEGVKVEKSISDDLKKLFESIDVDKLVQEENMTPQQALFLEQQLMALTRDPRGRRWHPTMIRFALSIFHKSPAAYGAMCESGMLTLPCRRTLFDYTHFKPVQDGIHYEVLEAIAKRLEKMQPYQHYHVIMCDEMYISKNIVFEKRTGRMVGFVSLNDVKTELNALDAYLKNPDDPNVKPTCPPLATKILTFFVKGVSNSVKEPIATYGVDVLTKEDLYRWSWDVIDKCEKSGIAIIAYTSDGSSVNRAFIKMNKPYHTNSNVVYSTINKCAARSVINKEKHSVRLLYFIADVPHLLKTIRNCFASSSNKRYMNKALGKMMLRRRLTKNGQRILWATIIRLYHHQKDKPLRLAYKLNAQNVFLNAFSKMKVKYAAEVLSATVAQLLENLNWENLEETIIFIRKVNEFFDVLNGAHSKQGARKKNPDLNPYCSIDDKRFEKLQSFLDYLEEWREDAEAAAAANRTVDESVHVNDPDDPTDVAGDDEWEDADEEQDPASVRQLSRQTIEGIKITVFGFTAAVKFLLGEGVKFINARVFSQDPIEQYFSKQRAKGGSSTNPNFSQALQNQRVIHIQGNLGVKKNYRGNTEVETACMTITDEPLPKRRRVASKKSP